MTDEQKHLIHSEDFQTVLKSLLAAYRPILDEAVRHSRSPEELKKEAESRDPSCDDEIALADRIFGQFFNEDVAYRILSPEGREALGPIDRWRWCFLHLRCCIIFGWLVCRGPRTFRSLAYYVYRYWRCVRQVLGTEFRNELTDDQRQDLQVLMQALAKAYKPYLTQQTASVEFPLNLADDILQGKVDCHEGEVDSAAVLERFFTAEIAPALLGRHVFDEHIRDPFFRVCRCLCLCSIRFGCCLARARTFVDVLYCLLYYFECVRKCFQRLIAEIDTPQVNACADATFVGACTPPFTGIEITGDAGGSAFTHYTLRYSWGVNPPLNDAVVYPDCTRPPANTQSNNPVSGGTLGYLDVAMLPPGITEFTIYLDVFGSGGLHLLVTRTFQIRTRAVEITAAATVNALVAQDPFHIATTIKLIKAVNNPNPAVPEMSIGGSFSVTGSAYTIGCDRILSQYVLTRFSAPPAAPVPTFPNAFGGSPLIGPVVYADTPGHPWQSGCFPISTPNIILNGNLVAAWSTLSCAFPMPHTVPKVRPLPFWGSAPANGRFVILLEARDRLLPAGPFPGSVAAVDQVAVWIDNQDPVGVITSIGGVTGCGDLHLKNYVGTTAEVRGIAYDPPIDATAPQQRPNDNFGAYSLTFQKNGGGSGSIPAATPNLRVPNVWPGPPGGDGTLANWDIVTALDGGAGPVPAGSPKIPRGERCAYVITLVVTDTTHVGDSGNNHSTGPILYAINVINDIP